MASTIPRRLDLLGFVGGPDFGRGILSQCVIRDPTSKVCENAKIFRGRTLRVTLGKSVRRSPYIQSRAGPARIAAQHMKGNQSRHDNIVAGTPSLNPTTLRRCRNWLMLLTLLAARPAIGQQVVDLVTHQERQPSDGQCINIAVDGAIVHLAAQVEADAPAGDYIYASSPGGPNQPSGNVDIRVNADHTFGYVGGNDAFMHAWNASAGSGTETITLTNVPSGLSHTEGTVIYQCSFACDNSNVGNLYNVWVPVTIGSAGSSPSYMKQCDRRTGGDAGDGGNGCSSCNGRPMARYTAHAMLASLNIEDTPIRYAPPRGPAINFTVTYNQRDTQQPQTFNYSNLGPKWTFNWLSYVTDDPNNASANATVYVAGGGAEKYSGFDSGSQSYLPDPQSHASLVRTAPAAYEKRFPDGSKQVFTLSDGSSSFPRKIFMTQWVDSTGSAVTIGYDGSFRITTLTDALGQVTTIAYELPGDRLPSHSRPAGM